MKRFKRIFLLFIILLFCILSYGCNVVKNATTSDPVPVVSTPTAEAPAITGCISGTVLTSAGVPVSGAIVYIGDFSTIATIKATTGSNGKYTLSGIPTGSQGIKIDGDTNRTDYWQYYYAPAKTAVISASSTPEVNFTLFPCLELKNTSISLYGGTLDWIQILGEITNNTASKKEYVKIYATVKNAAGTIVDSEFAYVSSTDLDSTETSTFTIYISSLKYSDLSNYTFSYKVDSW